MLVWFKCKNFSSFKEETILDMRAVKSYKEHPYNLIMNDSKDSLLKVVSIYGANASGKTNFVNAFHSFQYIVLNSFRKNNKNENQKSILDENFFPFFLCKECNAGNTEFEIVVRENNEEYKYGYIYNRSEIKEEWLYKRMLHGTRSMTIFERSDKKIELGASIKNDCEKYISAIDDDVLALSFFSSLSLSNPVFNTTINSITSIMAIDASERMEKSLLDQYFKSVYSEEDKPQLLSFLNAIDTGIVDIEVYRNPNNQNYDVFMIHLDENKKKIPFHMSIESAGTIKAIALFSIMRMAAAWNKSIIIDEFNTKLHPLLQKYLIDLFYEGTESGQFIYTTHDTSLMDKKYMRRDQIWFVGKNDLGESSLYSLSEFKVRNDKSFGKDYLAGIYGGIPILKDFSFVEER